MEMIKQGAEARVFKNGNVLIKQRFLKKYRIKELDLKLTTKRTIQEAKQLQRLKFVRTPTLYLIDIQNFTIYMEFVEGITLKDFYNSDSQGKFASAILVGTELALIHDQNCIHGDLTSSNIMIREDKLIWIDFGLSYVSTLAEDKAVDLYVLERALFSTHPMIGKELVLLINKV